jgi:hypothetical protein
LPLGFRLVARLPSSGKKRPLARFMGIRTALNPIALTAAAHDPNATANPQPLPKPLPFAIGEFR